MKVREHNKQLILTWEKDDDIQSGETINIDLSSFIQEITQNQQQNKDGRWSEAKPLPYYPSILERIYHRLGGHIWTYVEPKTCVMCKKSKE